MLEWLIRKYLSMKRAAFREKYQRRVSVGDLFSNRWSNAKELGYGEGTSLYDNTLVIGDVSIGKNTWVGPGVILDGSGKLSIGDNCSVSSGVQIYTHDSVDWALTGEAEIKRNSSSIGNNVYIGPNTVIQKGVRIGNRVVIGAMSFVNKDIPDNSKAYGIPIKIFPLENL